MRLLVCVAFMATWATVAGGEQSPRPLPLIEFTDAEFVLSDATSPPGDDADWQPVRLPDDWYVSRPGVSGIGWYRLTFTLPPGPFGMYSIYVPRRTARRVTYFINGARVGIGFLQGDTRVFNFDGPERFPVSPALLRAGPNVVHIMVESVAALRQGLPRVAVGPGGITFPIVSRRTALQVDVRTAFGGAALLAGLIAAAFWVRGREDRVMFWFAVTALAWALMSVPWFGPEFGELGFAGDVISFPLHFAYAVPLLVLCLRAAGKRSATGEMAIWLFTFSGAALMPFTSEAEHGAILTTWSAAYIIALAVLLTLFVATRARDSGVSTWILATSLTLVAVFNLGDFGRWMGWLDYDNLTLAPFHVPLVLLAVGATIVDRHFRAVGAVERARVDLERRVTEKTLEIETSYQRLREAEQERVLAHERSRIMADMHDGVGASLLSLLGIIRSGKAEPTAIERRVHEALMELRLAVDSLGTVDGDLGVVLGNVRHRMREAIEQSGVRFVWQVGELPSLNYLTPRTTLAIQRIVLEAIANALQHAHARTITVRTEVDHASQRLLIQVTDDGIGFNTAIATRGRGLNNLHNRARALGASVEIHSSPSGTSIVLVLSLAAVPA